MQYAVHEYAIYILHCPYISSIKKCKILSILKKVPQYKYLEDFY